MSRWTRDRPHYSGHTNTRLEDLIYETCAGALEDAGLTRDGVDSVVIAASDHVDGRCNSSLLTANAAGAYLNDEIKTAQIPPTNFL